MARVWKIELSHSQQSILLAMADHANDDGRRCYPSHRHLAWKTGYSERQVSRIINELIEVGIVKVIKLGTNKHPPHYWLRLDRGTPKKAYERERFDDDDDDFGGDILSPQDSRDDILSPQEANGGDILSPQNDSRDDTVSPPGVTNATSRGDTLSPKPSVNHQLQPSDEDRSLMNERMNESSAREFDPEAIHSFIRFDPDAGLDETINFERSYALLTDPEVGMDDAGAKRLAAAYGFEFIVLQVFDWRAHKGGKYGTIGALIHRIQAGFNTRKLIEGDFDSALFRRHFPDYEHRRYTKPPDLPKRNYRPPAEIDPLAHIRATEGANS